MNAQRLAVALTVINLVVLTLTATVGRTTSPPDTATLRGGALELVDESGRVRSRLNVEPNGEVVFRLLDRNGTIRVKLGAGEDGSGLLLLDEATEPAIHLIARRTATADRPTTTGITVRSSETQRRAITPCRLTKRCSRRS
jgi:hypothetical protein